MDIQKYIDILEKHRDDVENTYVDLPSLPTFLEVLEALDFAIDSLKAVDESLKEEAE